MRPQALAQRLKDVIWKWMKPEARVSRQRANPVVLKKFLWVLPSAVCDWVQRH